MKTNEQNVILTFLLVQSPSNMTLPLILHYVPTMQKRAL